MDTLNPNPSNVNGSEDFFQAQWNKFTEGVSDDDFKLWYHGTAIFTTLTYWLVGGIFVYMDFTLKPESLRKYKIQRGINEPLDWSKFKSALKVILFNQLVIGGAMLYGFYLTMSARGFKPIGELPSIWRIVIEIFTFVMIQEMLFYYSHRLLHYKGLYRLIHKKHHEWTSPIGVTAIYCNPIEHVVGNLTPVILGPILLRSHIVILWIWLFLAIVNTVSDHSGYHLPFMTSSEFHDFHHAKFTNNFGTIGLFDWWHGTDTSFRKTEAFKRHKLLIGLKSAREVFPDKVNKKKK